MLGVLTEFCEPLHRDNNNCSTAVVSPTLVVLRLGRFCWIEEMQAGLLFLFKVVSQGQRSQLAVESVNVKLSSTLATRFQFLGVLVWELLLLKWLQLSWIGKIGLDLSPTTQATLPWLSPTNQVC